MARGDKGELHDAMWSVHFFAAGLRPSALPRHIRPVPLRRAMDVLAQKWDDHDLPRRRRVLMDLAGAGASRLADPKTRASLSNLAQQADVDEKIFDSVHPPQVRRELGDRLMSAPLGTQDCIPVQHERTEVQYEPEIRRTTVTATVQIRRPLSDLPRVLDPQCWVRCSEFFDASYPVEKGDYATRVRKEEGKGWDGLLFERFKTPLATFENVLGIEYRVTLPQEIRLKYWLHDSPTFTFLGQTRLGVLEVDDGFMHARRAPRDPDLTEMVVRKSVVFADLTPYDPGVDIDDGQWLNYTAPAMLSLWVDDSAHARMCCKF